MSNKGLKKAKIYNVSQGVVPCKNNNIQKCLWNDLIVATVILINNLFFIDVDNNKIFKKYLIALILK